MSVYVNGQVVGSVTDFTWVISMVNLFLAVMLIIMLVRELRRGFR